MKVKLMLNIFRKFYDIDGVFFGWRYLNKQWQKEEHFIQSGNSKIGALTVDSVYPYRWNKMRVPFAKYVFIKSTLSESIVYFSQRFNYGGIVIS